jgi:hypothetical protein
MYIMAIPKDQQLYDKARAEADKTYKKASAYKSGFIVKKYKELYKDKYGNDKAYEPDNKEKPLKRWFQEQWVSVGGEYPTYRPTKRVNAKTPKTVSEIPKKRLEEQVKLKQKIKGKKNLPKF